MTQYIDKNILVSEIEKRLHANGAFDEFGDEAWAEDVGMCNAYKSILSFLNTLEVKEIGVDLGDSQGDIGVKWVQEEPTSNDLEYASEKYACRFSSSKYGHEKVKDAFIAGAQWQKEHLWKQSDKQMEALRIAAEVGTANDSWAMGILRDMYNDLKKLKEK